MAVTIRCPPSAILLPAVSSSLSRIRVGVAGGVEEEGGVLAVDLAGDLQEILGVEAISRRSPP
jgi:hypothetical protein